MRLLFSAALVLGNTILSIASPTLEAVERSISTRPTISCKPKTPTKPLPSHPPRTKTCTVASHNDGTKDDSSYILSALHSCNNGGHVVFKSGLKYLIGTALDLTFLKHIDIGM